MTTDFKLLFESAPGLYLVLLPNAPVFTIVAVSDAYLTATMTRRDEILGRGIFDVFPDNPEDPKASGVRNLEASLMRALGSGKADAMAVQKYDIRRPLDSTFEERFWSPINSPVLVAGKVTFLVHRVEDVTEYARLINSEAERDCVESDLRVQIERKETEVFLRGQELQEANRQLRVANEMLARLRAEEAIEASTALEKTERRYRTLVQATSSITWTRDGSGAFVEPQESWSLFTGQSRDQYRNWGWLDAIHPDDRSFVRQRWADVAQSREVFDIKARIWSAAANRHHHFISRGVPLVDRDGLITEWIGTVVDVDERKRLEEQLRHAAKLESLGVLAGGIAHDFNNLLTGIMGNASIALDTFQLRSVEEHAILERIMAASEAAAHLTRQMLAYSGKGSFQSLEVDLSETVQSISALVESSVPKNVRVRLELERDLPRIEADPGQLQQIVMNLIINGAEAVPERAGGIVVVRTGTQIVNEEHAHNFGDNYNLVPGLYVSLEVDDNGAGMDDQIKQKIFDPFFTTKTQGRGLGLAAVLGIVRGHKGALRVRSEAGRGTTFRLLFPVAKPRARQAGIKPLSDSKARGGSILVIDDEAVIRDTIRAVLAQRGYNVSMASGGPEGIEIFRRDCNEIRLVILDLTMPRMTGEETLRTLRVIRPSLPIILSSGYNQVEATRRFVGKGLVSFLQKPFTAGQLIDSVRSALSEMFAA